MRDDTDPPAKKVSHMTYADLVNFYAAHVARVDLTWFRIMYLHAAVVGVLIFFAEATSSYWLQRGLVFAFYSVNLLIFHICLQESYQAMRVAKEDLARFENKGEAVDGWFRNMVLSHKTITRVGVLTITWALVGWLLFQDVAFR
ncbi:MAG: hypothetical protein AAGF56_09890 [Pseudomonadota bacterium]